MIETVYRLRATCDRCGSRSQVYEADYERAMAPAWYRHTKIDAKTGASAEKDLCRTCHEIVISE